MRNTIRNRRIIRRINSNKAKIFILFAILFCTTALFIGFYVGTSSVLDTVENFNENYNAESGMLITKKDTIDEIDTEEIKYVDSKIGNKTIRVFQERGFINKYQVTSGSDLKGDNDILLDKNFLLQNNIAIGDYININGIDLRVVGTAISPDYITTKNSEQVLQANAEEFGIAFIKKESFDKYFNDQLIQTYFSYISDESLEKITTISEAQYIKDSKNNSRMKQVIGDAKAPKQLSLLVVSIFYCICIVLILVYHHGMFKKEKKNIEALYSMGESRKEIFYQYSIETNALVVFAWIIGGIVGSFSIDTVMQMNSKIYNYPILEVNKNLLFIVLVIALVIPLLFNNLIICRYYLRNSSYKKNIKSTKLQNKISESSLKYIYKYRLIKILRNKQEMAMFIVLIFIVGFLINFSFLLKSSVEQYVKDLDKENKFESIFFIDSGEYDLRENEENIFIYNLYDKNETIQTIKVVDKESEFYDIPIDSGIIISEAFHKKYKVGKGDEITLTDIKNSINYTLKIDDVNTITTVSEIYITKDLKDIIFDKETYYSTAIVTDYKELLEDNNFSKIKKKEVITSGRNILQVINKQITLIISISIIVEVFLMYSLFQLIISNSSKSIKILKMNGFSNNEIIKIHFLFNNVLAFIIIFASYLLGRVSVRIFLDEIMFTFVNFVDVINDIRAILFTNILIIGLYLMIYYHSKRKIIEI